MRRLLESGDSDRRGRRRLSMLNGNMELTGNREKHTHRGSKVRFGAGWAQF